MMPVGGTTHAGQAVHGEADHRHAEGGGSGGQAPDLCRRSGVSEQTVSRWKARYAGLEVSELRRLRQLEEENLVANLTRSTQALKELVRRKA